MPDKKQIEAQTAKVQARQAQIQQTREDLAVARERLSVLTFDSNESDLTEIPPGSIEGLTAAYRRGEASPLDILSARFERDELLAPEVERLTRAVKLLTDTAPTLDTSLAQAVAPAFGEIMLCPVEVAYEAPKKATKADAPRVYLWQKKPSERHPSGAVSGELHVAYLRAEAHRSAPMSGESQKELLELGYKLGDRGVKLSSQPARRGTGLSFGDGLLLDLVQLNVAYVMPEVVYTDGSPTDLGMAASSLRAIGAEVAAQFSDPEGIRGMVFIGGQSDATVMSKGWAGVDKLTVESDTLDKAGVIRTRTLTAELAAAPSHERATGDTNVVAARLRKTVEELVGKPIGFLGTVTAAEVLSSPGIFVAPNNVPAVANKIRLTFEAVVGDPTAASAA